MSRKRVVLRELARRDVEAAIDSYVRDADPDIALGFIEALESAYQKIVESPSAGPPRYAHEFAIPGLRSRALKNYPYLVFYIDRDDHIDVWRVVHSRRDIPARMQAAER